MYLPEIHYETVWIIYSCIIFRVCVCVCVCMCVCVCVSVCMCCVYGFVFIHVCTGVCNVA